MSAYWKDNFRGIKKSLGRYFSLIIITALGAMSVVGIQAASINMRAAADMEYKERAIYDIQIKSTIGFSDDDISALRDIPGVGIVMPTNIFDVYMYIEDQTRTMRTFELPVELNSIRLTAGRLPETPLECAVERAVLTNWGLQIGDSIILGLDDADDNRNMLKNREFTITGVVVSPIIIIPYARGNTHLGDGGLNYYMYLHPDAYATDFYTDAYVLMEESRNIDNLSVAYFDAVDEWISTIKQIGDKIIEDKVDEPAYAQHNNPGVIPAPEWFYFARKDDAGFESYYQDTMRLQNIGYFFPLVFFAVAIMVSLTTMSRMVDEQRNQIGIYRALGYSSLSIIIKYLLYASSASFLGGLAGIVAGSTVFPLMISDAYSLMYVMPPIETSIPVVISLIAMAASVGAVLIMTLIACQRSMRSSPADMMRPKSPPSGKRILLERIPFIWNCFGFISKVTSRNIFRYKKRFIMALLGIAGCGALLLTSFGLRDSIASLDQMQYGEIVKYTSRAYIKEITGEHEREEFDALIPSGKLYVREETVVAGNGYPVSLIIPEDIEELGEYINLYSSTSGQAIPLENGGVFITEKLARDGGVSVGDIFSFSTSIGAEYKAKVLGVVQNYVMHFMYMPPEHYEGLFGYPPQYNCIFTITDAEAFARALYGNNNVRALVDTEYLRTRSGGSTDAMEVVSIALIFLACALAFVVLFNLTNINITERTRELATIKTLGFFSRELSMYIYRENITVALMGIASGLVFGVFLHRAVLSAAEIDQVMFPRIISPLSYIYSAALSFAFTMLVNLVMNVKLARIDMVESMKSVE